MLVLSIDHFSFTVANLDRSTAFYELLGYEAGPRFLSSGDDVDSAAEIWQADMEIQMLHHAVGGPALELIYYSQHPGEVAPHNSRVGAAHVALAVADIEISYQELLAAGVHFNSPPNTDAAGLKWVYLRDPDGNISELVQRPPVDVVVSGASL